MDSDLLVNQGSINKKEDNPYKQYGLNEFLLSEEFTPEQKEVIKDASIQTGDISSNMCVLAYQSDALFGDHFINYLWLPFGVNVISTLSEAYCFNQGGFQDICTAPVTWVFSCRHNPTLQYSGGNYFYPSFDSTTGDLCPFPNMTIVEDCVGGTRILSSQTNMQHKKLLNKIKPGGNFYGYYSNVASFDFSIYIQHLILVSIA